MSSDARYLAKLAARASGAVSVTVTPAAPAVSPERSRIEQKLAAHAKAQAAQAAPPPAPQADEKPEPEKHETHERHGKRR
jgi:hypothetical protein